MDRLYTLLESARKLILSSTKTAIKQKAKKIFINFRPTTGTLSLIHYWSKDIILLESQSQNNLARNWTTCLPSVIPHACQSRLSPSSSQPSTVALIESTANVQTALQPKKEPEPRTGVLES